jgi:hypothetical protein
MNVEITAPESACTVNGDQFDYLSEPVGKWLRCLLIGRGRSVRGFQRRDRTTDLSMFRTRENS